jgi:hypothetical protein
MNAAQQAHAADRLIEDLIVAGLGFAAFQTKFGPTAKPGGS